MTEKANLTPREQEIILRIVNKGSCAEVRRKTDGTIVIYEVKKNKAC